MHFIVLRIVVLVLAAFASMGSLGVGGGPIIEEPRQAPPLQLQLPAAQPAPEFEGYGPALVAQAQGLLPRQAMRGDYGGMTTMQVDELQMFFGGARWEPKRNKLTGILTGRSFEVRAAFRVHNPAAELVMVYLDHHWPLQPGRTRCFVATMIAHQESLDNNEWTSLELSVPYDAAELDCAALAGQR